MSEKRFYKKLIACADKRYELIAKELTLRDVRKALDLTQERIAELLEIGQDSVSRIEKRSDLLLSTLRGYIRAMGGELRLVAQFPDRPPIMLCGFSGEGVGSTTTKKAPGAKSTKTAR